MDAVISSSRHSPPGYVSLADAVRVVELATHAPSVHNTQPWAWQITGTTIELYADRRRQLPAADPRGRDLLISCGAALHHAETAARGLGWAPTTRRVVGTGSNDLLARIDLAPGLHGVEHVADLHALLERRTDRRRFTSWPVDQAHLQRLCAAARARGTLAVPVCEVIERLRLDHLLSRARRSQAADPILVEEHRRWLDHSDRDGVPAALVPVADGVPASHRSRFAQGRLHDVDPDPDPDLASGDGLIVLCTDTDDPADWLGVGEALSAAWLTAVRSGLSVVPLTQVVEVDETRTELHLSLLAGLAVPQLLLRVGWAPLGRRDLPRTPRRPVREVLVR